MQISSKGLNYHADISVIVFFLGKALSQLKITMQNNLSISANKTTEPINIAYLLLTVMMMALKERSAKVIN